MRVRNEDRKTDFVEWEWVNEWETKIHRETEKQRQMKNGVSIPQNYTHIV